MKSHISQKTKGGNPDNTENGSGGDFAYPPRPPINGYFPLDTSCPNVQKFIDEIKASKNNGVSSISVPVIVPIQFEKDNEINQCLINVEKKVKKDGGSRVLGWMLRHHYCMVADFHAVWETPDKRLLDVTPKEVPTDEILFLPASNARYEGKQIFSIHFNYAKNPLIDDFISCRKMTFYLMNKGKLSSQYGDVALWGKDAVICKVMVEVSQMLGKMIRMGLNSYDAPCLCPRGYRYKECHGAALHEIIKQDHIWR